MAVKQKRFTIDGVEYDITQLGAVQGRKIWLKLLQSLAAPVKVLGEANLSNATMALAVGTAIEGLDADTLEELYEAFGQRCRVRVGERWPELVGEVFDQHFAGEYVAMTKWLGECIAFNYAGFLGGASLGSMLGQLQAMTAKVSKSQPNSTGSSGESSRTNTAPEA